MIVSKIKKFIDLVFDVFLLQSQQYMNDKFFLLSSATGPTESGYIGRVWYSEEVSHASSHRAPIYIRLFKN